MVLENTTEAAPNADPTVRSEGLLAGLGTVAGLGAIAASSCCVLPLALGGLGATGAVLSGLDVLVALRPYLVAGAVLTIVAGWAVFLYRRREAAASCSEGVCATAGSGRRAIMLLGLAKVSVVLALVWEPFFEPALLGLVQ